MHKFILLLLLLTQLHAVCSEGECGPHPGMPNYLCDDGVTMAGPGSCVELASGDCEWEIVTCMESLFVGYLRVNEVSFCMDECAQYHMEAEIDAGFGALNVIPLSDVLDLSPFVDRFVEVEIGQEVNCVECSAFEILSINISNDCQYPVECFIDPCEYAEDCQLNIPVECVSNYCGDCHADFYDLSGNLVDCNPTDCNPDLSCGSAETCCYGLLYPTTCCSDNCDEPIGGCGDNLSCNDYSSCDECTEGGCFWQSSQSWTGVGICEHECAIADMDCFGDAGYWNVECPEVTDCLDLNGLDFGWCDMYLGIGYLNGECQHVSGCDWLVDYTDYSDAFFNSIEDCENSCLTDSLTCNGVYDVYEELHGIEYSFCELDNDCVAVWGDCDVGLGGCHYSVNEEAYLENDVNELVNMWLDGDCMEWVCDCSSPPYAQCMDGVCASAYCMEENPVGCFQSGCDVGYECMITEECVPSMCFCDDFYGEWYCTEDCGGGSCVALGMIGDLNGDGQINVVDIVMAVNIVLSGHYDVSGDINSDGQLNIFDIVMLVNIVLEG